MRRGFTIVEVVVAASLFLVAGLGLAGAMSYARRHVGVYLHRAQAEQFVHYVVENHMQMEFDNGEGTRTRTIPFRGGGSYSCTVTAVTDQIQDSDAEDYVELTVAASWVEPLLPSRPTLQYRVVTYFGDWSWEDED